MSQHRCHYCQLLHNSTLCENQLKSYSTSVSLSETSFQSEQQRKNPAANEIPNIASTNENKNGTVIQNNSVQTTFGLLPTAYVNVIDSMGQKRNIRMLCDSGSESTLLSESCINLLGFKRKNARFPVKGLAESEVAVTKGCVEIELMSIHDASVRMPIKAFVLDKLTAALPSQKINEKDFSHLKNVKLADPYFHIPDKIDIILGSDYLFSILLPGQITCSQSDLIAQNSIFGFLISGKLPESQTKSNSLSNMHIYEINIDSELKRFWELEEVPNSTDTVLSPEEQFVETHFRENYSINSDGRFVVKLPFLKSKSELGNSKPAALSRLYAMERKFKENSEFENQYKDFMHEYENLGHMELVTQNCLNRFQNEQYFLPHHAVIKPSSTTTKLRVVFDASCKTSNGKSLNSILGVGPKLQRDIFEILLNFRFPEIVFSADIEKMYRQVLVSDEDRNYQQILWRFNPNEEIRTYKLNTVTYGLAPASFLATRCIKQIALDYSQNSAVSHTLLHDVYMDDLLSGSSTDSDAISLCKEITNILQTHGFHLRKWNSNSNAFLAEFQEHCSTDTNLEIIPNDKESTKVLGLFWNSSTDTFIFKPALALTSPLTKRHILSQSARIFDPLGLISPCTVVMKIFYQKLWLTKGDWDSPIPQSLAEDLFKFQKSFNAVEHFTVPRGVTLISSDTFELHGFCDASTLAYAAAIYCKQIHGNEIKVFSLSF
ncbi:uncharacterized protein LOC118204716 [Stegodyphus dumicola]|uniref:uncharacterized protein LOC118204716 n=1 Tax=Stegodyphus dumicola TaxID=202533 RepID=UPI0015AD463B|nr:uncharacterized protein LOC118204716 [Stegodyphus dumicola]